MVLRDVDILEERLNSETDRPNKKNIIECAKLQAERGGDEVWNSECGVRNGINKAWSMAHRAG